MTLHPDLAIAAQCQSYRKADFADIRFSYFADTAPVRDFSTYFIAAQSEH
ncbi:hypothetical protein Z945_2897 [Sulfitobacter noctilucae]|nr:hypothetical protein Z945_2897 [Sulfitobacter noctilucae]